MLEVSPSRFAKPTREQSARLDFLKRNVFFERFSINLILITYSIIKDLVTGSPFSIMVTQYCPFGYLDKSTIEVPV